MQSSCVHPDPVHLLFFCLLLKERKDKIKKTRTSSSPVATRLGTLSSCFDLISSVCMALFHFFQQSFTSFGVRMQVCLSSLAVQGRHIVCFAFVTCAASVFGSIFLFSS